MKNYEWSTVGVALGGFCLIINGLIQRFIWDKPEMIYFLFSLYLLGLILELICDWKAGEFSHLSTRRKTLRVVSNSLGAVILLFMASGIARFSVALFWMPQGILALLFSTIAIMITKYCSKLGWVTPQLAEFIESKVKTSIEKQQNDNDQNPPATPGFPDGESGVHETDV